MGAQGAVIPLLVSILISIFISIFIYILIYIAYTFRCRKNFFFLYFFQKILREKFLEIFFRRSCGRDEIPSKDFGKFFGYDCGRPKFPEKIKASLTTRRILLPKDINIY